MRPTELSHHRARLAKLMGTLREEVSHMTDETLRGGGGEASGGISDVPLHPADLGSHEYETRLAIDLLGQKREILAAVKDAWERLDQGTYGQCEHCGQPIARERLDAIPYVSSCRPCAEVDSV